MDTIEKGKGYLEAKSKLEKILENVREFAFNKFDKVYDSDAKFRQECEDITNYALIKDFLVALSKEIEFNYGPIGCSDYIVKDSKKRTRRISKHM